MSWVMSLPLEKVAFEEAPPAVAMIPVRATERNRTCNGLPRE